MGVVTSRADFEKLVDLRLEEAKNLIDQGNWDGAYYLAGYAVEFALKVRIISRLMRSNSFPEKNLCNNFYGHDLTKLLRAAELEGALTDDPAISPQWEAVKDWSEQSRYRIGATEREAKDLYDAITNEVVPWIKARW